MTPQINDVLSGKTEYIRQPDLTFRVNEDTVTGKISRLEAIKQSVYHILSTERYSNPIYDDDYGVELEQYIGKDIGYIKATIQQTLQDALLQDDRIKSVYVTDISKSDKQHNACLITFTVSTIYGDYQDNLNLGE